MDLMIAKVAAKSIPPKTRRSTSTLLKRKNGPIIRAKKRDGMSVLNMMALSNSNPDHFADLKSKLARVTTILLQRTRSVLLLLPLPQLLPTRRNAAVSSKAMKTDRPVIMNLQVATHE
jgi:hypothetical protein